MHWRCEYVFCSQKCSRPLSNNIYVVTDGAVIINIGFFLLSQPNTCRRENTTFPFVSHLTGLFFFIHSPRSHFGVCDWIFWQHSVYPWFLSIIFLGLISLVSSMIQQVISWTLPSPHPMPITAWGRKEEWWGKSSFEILVTFLPFLSFYLNKILIYDMEWEMEGTDNRPDGCSFLPFPVFGERMKETTNSDNNIQTSTACTHFRSERLAREHKKRAFSRHLYPSWEKSTCFKSDLWASETLVGRAFQDSCSLASLGLSG